MGELVFHSQKRWRRPRARSHDNQGDVQCRADFFNGERHQRQFHCAKETMKLGNTSISPGKVNGQLVESGHDIDGA